MTSDDRRNSANVSLTLESYRRSAEARELAILGKNDSSRRLLVNHDLLESVVEDRRRTSTAALRSTSGLLEVTALPLSATKSQNLGKMLSPTISIPLPPSPLRSERETHIKTNAHEGSIHILNGLLRAQSAAASLAMRRQSGTSATSSREGTRPPAALDSVSNPLGLPALPGTGYPLPPPSLPFYRDLYGIKKRRESRPSTAAQPSVAAEPLGPVVPPERREALQLQEAQLPSHLTRMGGDESTAATGAAANFVSPSHSVPASQAFRARIVYDSLDPSPFQTALHPELALASHGLDPGLCGLPYYPGTGPSDQTLVFESRFESGNLRRAIQSGPYEYELILRPDVNTRGHTQWYYFSVANVRKGVEYRFRLVNFQKDDSLYNAGMRPCMFSTKAFEARGEKWHRGGADICYYRNGLGKKSGGKYYTLTLSMTFEYDLDTVFLSHCFPFTYTDLQLYLHLVASRPGLDRILTRTLLGTSLAGNRIDLLKISDLTSPPEVVAQRKAVVVSARVHPGESNASLCVKGLLDFLLDPMHATARQLRARYTFYVVPMLNPDGVICGNYRCSLSGADLNRCWDKPNAQLHPEIFAMKAFLTDLSEKGNVLAFIDIHGHSRRKSVFAYGCEKKPGREFEPGGPLHRMPGSLGMHPGVPVALQEKVLPYLLYKRNPWAITFRGSCWRVQRNKEGTARIVGWKELGIVNSFTLEASFCGPHAEDAHFGPEHLEDIGRNICEALYDLDQLSGNPTALSLLLNELGAEVDALRSARADAGPVDDSEGSDDELQRGSGGGRSSVVPGAEAVVAREMASRTAARTLSTTAPPESGVDAAYGLGGLGRLPMMRTSQSNGGKAPGEIAAEIAKFYSNFGDSTQRGMWSLAQKDFLGELGESPLAAPKPVLQTLRPPEAPLPAPRGLSLGEKPSAPAPGPTNAAILLQNYKREISRREMSLERETAAVGGSILVASRRPPSREAPQERADPGSPRVAESSGPPSLKARIAQLQLQAKRTSLRDLERAQLQAARLVGSPNGPGPGGSGGQCQGRP